MSTLLLEYAKGIYTGTGSCGGLKYVLFKFICSSTNPTVADFWEEPFRGYFSSMVVKMILPHFTGMDPKNRRELSGEKPSKHTERSRHLQARKRGLPRSSQASILILHIYPSDPQDNKYQLFQSHFCTTYSVLPSQLPK